MKADVGNLWQGAMMLGTSKAAKSETRKHLGEVRAFTLIQLLLEFQSQKSRAHALHLEEYFRFQGVSRQPLELLNHVGLGKSETSSRRREGTVEVDHKIQLDNLYEVNFMSTLSMYT